MTRFILAAMAFVGICYGVASADYVLVKIDLNNQILNPPLPPPVQPGSQQGGQAVQGLPGFVPKGFGGGKGKFGGQKGFGQQGFPGQQGLVPPVQALPGQPGYIPPGQPGGPPLQPGMPGYDPTQPGGQGQAGIGGQAGQGGAGQQTTPKLPPIYIYAYLDVKPNAKLFAAGNYDPFVKVEYKPADQKTFEFWVPTEFTKVYKPSWKTGWHVPAEFNDQFNKIQAEIKNGVDENKKKKLIAVADWGLQRGVGTDVKKPIEALKKIDPKHPVVAAFDKTTNLLAKPPTIVDPAAALLVEELKKEGYRNLESDQGHYTLLTNIKSTSRDADLKRKLAKLEQLYATYFYWHALRERPLAPPAYRLVVVVVDTPANPQDFFAKHAAMDSVPMVGTGFNVQRDNVVFMSSRRLDEAYSELDRYNEDQWDKFNTGMNELLGNLDMTRKRVMATKKTQDDQVAVYYEILKLHVLALCQKSMEDENENLTLSHTGVRQLIAATALMPRDVQTAEWARVGLASFFEFPAQAFHASTGGPNWNHLIQVKVLARTKKLEKKDAKDILISVISDDFFHQANNTLKLTSISKEMKDKLEPQAQKELGVARATAWSLVYYLAHNKDKEFARYLREINNLPRDLDYDGKVLRECFFRAFDLMAPDAANAGKDKLDVGKLQELANNWFTAIERTALDGPDYEKSLLDEIAPIVKTAPAAGSTINPGAPGAGGKGPAGFPGAGGQGGFPGTGGKTDPPGAGGGVNPPGPPGAGGGGTPPPGTGGGLNPPTPPGTGSGGAIPPDKVGKGGRE